MMSPRNGWATTTRTRTAWYQTIPGGTGAGGGPVDQSTWNRQTSAATKTSRSATLRLVLGAADPLDQDGAGQHDDGQEDRIGDEDAEGEHQAGDGQARRWR